MGQGNACVGQDARGRRDSRDDFKGDAGLVQVQGLFATATEDERITAFEADDYMALTSAIDEERMDRVLRGIFAATAFADCDLLTRAGH